MAHITRITLLALAFPVFAHAGPFIDIGLSKQIDSIKGKEPVCITDWDADKNVSGCSDDPLGYFSVGYRYKNFTAQVEHWSSLREKDIGLNLLTIKYRFEFWK
jgi:hypothetical protein